ncbi:MAG: ABC transporter ATP-binding protein [Gemmatimonadota bacterium]
MAGPGAVPPARSVRISTSLGAGRTPAPERSLPGGVGRGDFRRLLRFLRPHRRTFSWSLACMVLAALFDAFSLILLIPFLRSLFDMGPLLPGGGRNPAERLIGWVAGPWLGEGGGLSALRAVCLLVLTAIVLKNLFLYVAKLLSIRVQERVERDMRDAVYVHLQRLPLGFFERTKAGQLMARVLTDTRQSKAIVSYALADGLRQLVTIAAYLATLAVLSWRLTLMTLVLAPLVVVALRPVLRRLRRRFRAVYDQQGELMSVLEETVSGIRLVKSYGAEAHEAARFREYSDRYSRDLIRTEALAQLSSPLSEVLASLVALGLVMVGASLVLSTRALGPEQFLAFVTIALRTISPIKAVSQFPARAQQALAAADRFLEVLDAPPEPVGARAGRAVSGFEDSIRLEGVSFAYEPGHPVLRSVDLVARKGEVIALVGPSGAGKSTLVDLLPRFMDPDKGRILLDGTDLREISLDSLRSLMGIVSQETVLFNDTVRANIAYGDSHRWSRVQVEEAARAANAHEFIVRMPAGYDTRIGDRGVRLSGGQRQRLGIARALLRDPPILILDEATSSLDTEAERLIQAAIARLLLGRTVFVIAHRLSTVREADRILVMEAGEIVERGTHGELYARAGAYRRLYESQLGIQPVPAS